MKRAPAGEGRRHGRVRLTVTAAVLALAGCAPAPPAREADVVRTLVADFAAPLANALFVGSASDCRSAGATDAPVAADLFAAFLDANRGGAPLDLAPYAARLRLADDGLPPNVLAAREGKPVVVVSRAGIAADAALMCVEVYGAEPRGFLLSFARARDGGWRIGAEHEVWREREPTPEELPDGTELAP